MIGIAGIIQNYLSDNDNVYVDLMPATPSECICIYDVAGRSPDFTFDGTKFRKPSIQVVVRSYTYDNGYSILQDVIESIENLEGATEGGYQFLVVEQTSDVFSWDFADEKNRTYKCFSVNFNFEIVKTI